MKILADRKVRGLAARVLFSLAVFVSISSACVAFWPKEALLGVLLSFTGCGMVIFLAIYLYFHEQSRMIENAAVQIEAYISGDRAARIKCDEEGELYYFFHKVNSLAAILNAHVEKEGQAKEFLKNMISDISHQLKTPLAALHIYNGIMQEEGRELPAIREFAELSEKEMERIETLAQQLLKIAKLDAGAMIMEPSLQNVSEMMWDLRRQMVYRAKQEEKSFILSGSGELLLLCDRNWLTEAVRNIVKNAFDHTERGEHICRASCPEDSSSVWPSDGR